MMDLWTDMDDGKDSFGIHTGAFDGLCCKL